MQFWTFEFSHRSKVAAAVLLSSRALVSFLDSMNHLLGDEPDSWMFDILTETLGETAFPPRAGRDVNTLFDVSLLRFFRRISVTKFHVQCVARIEVESGVATAYRLMERQALGHSKRPQMKQEHASSPQVVAAYLLYAANLVSVASDCRTEHVSLLNDPMPRQRRIVVLYKSISLVLKPSIGVQINRGIAKIGTLPAGRC
uniref:Uncharacterized protein n=1 Tax=Heterorhabditis bacteriophora TaxID=37862 RepID=A0A1I7WY07_HETBA